jgi:hypothetical protein
MKNLFPIEHKSQRVLTTAQLADGYETDVKRISENFQRNHDRYIQNIHYFKLEGEELRKFKESAICGIAPNVNYFFLWTEKGALLHAKSLNTDRAWEVYGELVDTYFRAKETQIDYSKLSPELQMVQALLLSSAKLETEVRQLQTTTQAIKDTIIQQPDNWREEINRMCNKISYAIGSNKYQEIRRDSYKLLESRAHVDLERRLDNLRARLLKEGASKTAINEKNKMDVIDADPKLREIYTSIVREYMVKHVA